MFTNPIKAAIEYNKIPLDHVPGKRVYYARTKNYISLILYILFGVFPCFFLFTTKVDSFVAVIVLYEVFILLLLMDAIGKLMTMQPVFIADGGKIYYLKTGVWYDIKHYKFEDAHVGRWNWFLTYQMIDRKGKVVFSEKNWNLNLENKDELESYIKWVKLSDEQKEKVLLRRSR